MKIVPLHKGPSLNDIPAQLRALADSIQTGTYGPVDTLFTLMPRDGDFPIMHGWGDVTGPCDPIIQLNLALHWHCRTLTLRTP